MTSINMSLHYYPYTFIYFNGLMPNTKSIHSAWNSI